MTLAVKTTDAYPTRLPQSADHQPREHPTVWPGHSAGPMSAEQLESYERKGFNQFGLLGADEVAQYWDELGRLSRLSWLKDDERTVLEKSSQEVRSVFDVHRISDVIAELVADERVAGRARQVLGSEVYVHQSRINYMPGFRGAGFYWHSDFETWHAEDGMPLPRACSISIALTDNYPFNGGLMVLPGSHRSFVPCIGETPEDHYRESLRAQEIGTPDEDTMRDMAYEHGIEQFTGSAGQALLFDCNMMHGSGNNITPFPRSNIFIVFNSVHNALDEPYSATAHRPEFVAHHGAPTLRG